MAQQPTSGNGASTTLFGPNSDSTDTPYATNSSALPPASNNPSNYTFLMPNSPNRGRRASEQQYRPSVIRTLGQRPACLVNASLTYTGNSKIYAFGGFDQYTDEGLFNSCVKRSTRSPYIT